MKTCSQCNTEKPISEYHLKYGKPIARCKICQNAATRKHYTENKQYYIDKADSRRDQVRVIGRKIVLDHLRDNPCVDCGNDDLEVLQFDHRDPSVKVNHVSSMLAGSPQKLKNEIGKCDVRCANCHVKKTRRQFGFWTVDTLK